MKYIYTAILIPEEDGSGFFARVPDLPGCITTGRDLQDAVEMITDAASI
ncbi:MAG: type II toxin-antitoxin system HicB family antitoxin [Clostridiales bacterium]|nr:type II toxin-antitoxin system HicB family antitoxin [Clostridiales bacterium]